ncbi:CAP domain-containing protein [Aeribacillus pallidus]|uniref:CAP domain-containing protein n=1 Tax=Aeribacillus pallidus TaxID=33936 RepID=UPI003D1DC660
MKKKALLSTVTSFALLVSPLVGKAEAAQGHMTTHGKVYVYQMTDKDVQKVHQWIDDILASYQSKNSKFYKQIPVEEGTQPKCTEVPKTIQVPESNSTVTTPPQQVPSVNQPTNSSSYEVKAFEQKVVELTNNERAKFGLPALTFEPELAKVAREKANDMARNHYFSHTSPTYGSPFDMMKQFGISYRTAGENIAMGQRSPEQVVNDWMNSEGHRKNILNPNFTHIGVGYVENGHYWTQMFIGK